MEVQIAALVAELAEQKFLFTALQAQLSLLRRRGISLA